MRSLVAFAAAGLILAPAARAAEDVYAGPGASIRGDPKYGPGFTNFEYANPDAPKGKPT